MKPNIIDRAIAGYPHDCGEHPNITLDDVVAGFNYSGFEYGEEDESPYIHIYSKYQVQF